jgi:hypothetical protein
LTGSFVKNDSATWSYNNRNSHYTFFLLSRSENYLQGFDKVFSGYQPRLIAREDFIKFTRRESTKTYIISKGFANRSLEAVVLTKS